jgi:SAM-dependent methyltransferase
LWLAGLGYQVDAVDVSAVALARLAAAAAERGLSQYIHPLHADLSHWRPPPETYDLALVSLYLERSLLPALQDALEPGGLILYTTFHTDLLRLQPHDNPAYLLQPGELLTAFPGWQILAYEERRLPPDSENRHDCMSSLLARKVGVER